MATRVSYKWRSKLPGDGPSRRQWLLAATAGSLRAARDPVVEAFDLSLLDGEITHNELFFVREHFAAPAVSIHDWKLNCNGAALSYEQLSGMPLRTLAATLECAENPPGGGLVSHTVWEGVPLAGLLPGAPPKPFVRFSSRDGFSRTIPAAKALHADSMLALRMNGYSLAPGHGGPVRALIPGWYAVDSVKWLEAMEFTDSEDTAKEYRRQTRSLLGASTGDAVTAVLPKSVFSRPVQGAVLSGRRFILRGAAWAGERRVARVEVSTDGGATWTATNHSESRPYCWSLWRSEWKIPRPGEYQLAVRVVDDAGRGQPAERESTRVDPYEQNHWQRITVTTV